LFGKDIMLEIEVSKEERQALLEQFNVANAVPKSDETAKDAFVIVGDSLCNRYSCGECPFTKAYKKAGLFLRWDLACKRWMWEAFLEACPAGTASAFDLFSHSRNQIEWRGNGRIVVETLYRQLEKHLKVRKKEEGKDVTNKSNERGKAEIIG